MAQKKLVVAISVEGLPALAAIKNQSLAQQRVIDALYGVVRATRIGSLALRLRAEQRLGAAEADLRAAAERIEGLREEQLAGPPPLCPDAQDFETEEGYEEAVREWDEQIAKRNGFLGKTESLADEMMP